VLDAARRPLLGSRGPREPARPRAVAALAGSRRNKEVRDDPSAIAAYPDVPSFKSLGYDVEYTAWAGLVAPRETPPPVVKALRDAMRQTMKEPEVVNTFTKLDTPVAYLDADEFSPWWDQDARRLASVVQKIGKVESAQ
jgi:tripartite-type tricarboxylate transporter receptor subunit TctC